MRHFESVPVVELFEVCSDNLAHSPLGYDASYLLEVQIFSLVFDEGVEPVAVERAYPLRESEGEAKSDDSVGGGNPEVEAPLGYGLDMRGNDGQRFPV